MTIPQPETIFRQTNEHTLFLSKKRAVGTLRGRRRGAHATVSETPLPEFHRRYGRLQSLLRLPHESQRGQETDSRKRGARRHAAGYHRFGAAVRLCHRQIRQRLSLRPQQHQALHGGRTVRLGRRQPAGRGAGVRGRRGLGGQHDAVRRLRRDVGRQRMGAIDGRTACDHRAVEVVSPEQTRHLLRFFQRQPQPRRIPVVPLRRGRRRHLRLAMGLRRLVGGGRVGRSGDRLPASRHP